ncbi:hypothetical protein GEMRC1_006473 [Eukaryota sp. GEM-RC1]
MQDDLQSLYAWVDAIPLSRPKKNIARDFSDCVLFSEVVNHFFPHLVDLHNFVPCHAVAAKISNWDLMQFKVLKKLKVSLDARDVELAANSVPGAIERVLKAFKHFVDNYKSQKSPSSSVGGTPIQRTKLSHPSPLPKDKTPKTSTQISPEVLDEKDAQIKHLQNTVDILESKLTKLSQLVRLKDSRISALTARLAEFESSN